MKRLLTTLLVFLCFSTSHASTGTIEDQIADVASWIILLVLPFAGIFLFWKAHIYPEKIAEQKNHPQLNAIKSMCLLSLIFGGLLWPVALIWANYDYKKGSSSTSNQEDDPATSATEEKEEEGRVSLEKSQNPQI